MANRHSNKPILMARNGQIKVLPLYMEPPIDVGGADIVTGGCAPVAVTLNGVTEFCYFPSDLGTVQTGGAAITVVTIGGVLCATYPATGGVEMGGEAPVAVTLGGVTTWCYPATGGVTLGGEADVTFTSTARERGGKGKPMYRREATPQRTIHYYEADAFFDSTLQLGGEADVMFIPARFQFIKSLPKLPKPDLYQDSEFKILYKELQKRQPSTTFSYVAEPSNMKFGGNADEDYFDFTNFIIMHDDDVIIADILATDGNPFITTTFSQNLARQKRDDEDLLNILELL